MHQQYSPVFIPTEVKVSMQVGCHISKLIVVWVTKFFNHATNIGKVTIKGKRINKDSGYGLQIPKETVFPATG